MSLKAYFDGFFGVMERLGTVGEIEAAARWVGEFYIYIDSLAAANPHRFHHVYEWGQVGDNAARLFELNVKPSGVGTVISYEFIESVTANENGQFFPRKAWVMESGDMVSFETDRPVPIDDGVFRTGRFTFKPGGEQTTGAFGEAFLTFFGAKLAARPRGGSSVIVPQGFTRQHGMADGARVYDSIISK